VNKKPGEPLGKLESEFVRFMLSKQGQEIVIKDGYYPLPATAINEDLATLAK
jgi:phosphate transport system substrate-binding protein